MVAVDRAGPPARPFGADLVKEVRQVARSLLPQAVLNWREARFYANYGEVELHLLDILCDPQRDAIDVGANDGSYIHFLRRHAKRVMAYEPMPHLAHALRDKFPYDDVVVETLALSDSFGNIELRVPVVDGVAVTGCSTISQKAAGTYPAHRTVPALMNRLDDVYDGDVGFIKIDVEGHEQAVLDGAVDTLIRCQPRMLVEVDERLSPGGLARARTYFDVLGYRGYYVRDGHLERIERFSIERLQALKHLPDLTAPLQQRARFPDYIYNFIFLPPDEPDDTRLRLNERLATL
ncbi:MAG TPA: FkbM family methyltransferase [Reyranellaceae bacterium]|nr:FkbM family methyltransferase [Reyranellaceae bacterium]